jgi:hypothetical protein
VTKRRMPTRLGKVFRAGSSGVRIVWRDGTETIYAPHSIVTLLSRAPLRIEGRLYRVSRPLAYEAPSLDRA